MSAKFLNPSKFVMLPEKKQQLGMEFLTRVYYLPYSIGRKEFHLFDAVSRNNIAVEFCCECCKEFLYYSGGGSVDVKVLPAEFDRKLLSGLLFKFAYSCFLICFTSTDMAASCGAPVKRTKAHCGAQLQSYLAF